VFTVIELLLNSLSFLHIRAQRQQATVQLNGALHYKQEARGFDSQLCHWNFLLT